MKHALDLGLERALRPRVAPPQLDEFFCTNEAHLRAKELEELGLSAEEIWSRPLKP